ncbi:MAG: Mut7-C RNAse domain-containing protein [Chloroflexi bacterium]|nr:Mut7-C RNAse domain-containing protein [Chloroflexota bacterium]
MCANAEELRFLVDANVGKLVRWLRTLGFDTVFAPAADDDDLLRWAEREGRVLLTRDRGLAGRRSVSQGRVRAVLARSEQWQEQLAELARVLPLVRAARPFTRCVACNTPLVPCPLDRAWRRVPVYVYQTQGDFRECPACGRVYWRGTHWSHQSQTLKELLDIEIVPSPGPTSSDPTVP